MKYSPSHPYYQPGDPEGRLFQGTITAQVVGLTFWIIALSSAVWLGRYVL